MKRLSPATSITTLVFFVLPFCPASLNAVPSLSLSVDEGGLVVRKPFSVELIISWEGDPEQYLVETPHLKLPEGIVRSGTSYSTSAKENMYYLRYQYTLCAATAGSYVLDPVEISYWEKDAGEARIARTEELHFTVSAWSEAALKRYWVPGVVLLIFISLFMMLFVLSTKKKRPATTAPTDDVAREQIIDHELKQCRAYKLSGDWDTYVRQVIAVLSKLPSDENHEKTLKDLYRLAERVQYGGYRPSENEIDLIERQLETACAGAFSRKDNATDD